MSARRIHEERMGRITTLISAEEEGRTFQQARVMEIGCDGFPVYVVWSQWLAGLPRVVVELPFFVECDDDMASTTWVYSATIPRLVP